MPSHLEQIRELLSDLETEFVELVTAHAPAYQLQIVSALIMRTRLALEEHVSIVPAELQHHPRLVALKKKVERDRTPL